MTNSTVAIVVDNAKRLLSDAELLFNNERYGSAVSLAILSLEEAGKACLIHWKDEGIVTRDIKNDIRSFHFHKQRVLGCFITAKEMILALADYCDHPSKMPKMDKSHSDFESDNDFARYLYRTCMTHFASDTAALEYIARRSYEKSAAYRIVAESRRLDHVKQLGFYVDVDENLVVKAPFIEPSRALAEEVIALAKEAMTLSKKNTFLHVAMAAIYENGPMYQKR